MMEDVVGNPNTFQADADARNRYFVSSSFAAEIRDELRDGLPGIFDRFALRPYWAEDELTGVGLLNKIRRMIELTHFGLYDLSGIRPNVMIELGIAIALNKPCVLIALKGDTQRHLPDFVQGLDILYYQTFNELRERLLSKVPDTWWGLDGIQPQGLRPCVVEGGRECPRPEPRGGSKGRTYLIAVGDRGTEQDCWGAIEVALSKAGLAISPVLLTDPGEHDLKLCDYCDKVRQAEFSIFSLGTSLQPEPDSSVYLTLGMSLGLERPRLLVRAKTQRKLPALLLGMNCYEYASTPRLREGLWSEMERRVLPALRPRENPFRGLRPYGEEDACEFESLGRAGEVAEVVGHLGRAQPQAVVVFGRSGVGKTSLIRAGVLPHPRIREMGLIPLVLPSDEIDAVDLERRLRQTLSEAMPGVGVEKSDFAHLSDELNTHHKNLLLVFDQFEGLYEQDRYTRQAVLELIATLVRETRFKFLIGIRREVYSVVDEPYRDDRKLFPDPNMVRVPIMGLGREQAVDAIAFLARGFFAKPMVEKLVGMLYNDEGKLYTPYIQIVCQRLWNDLVRDRQDVPIVTASDCDEARGRDAMVGYLDSAVNGIRPSQHVAMARRVLRALVENDRQGLVKRLWVPEQDLAGEAGVSEDAANEIIRQLSELRLVALDGVKGHYRVQIIHDFLGQAVVKYFEGEYYSCFVSYSSKDGEFAERLHEDLKGRGVACWYAPDDMKIGDRIRQRIDESIEKYEKLLLVLSEASVNSSWVEKEVETAFEKEQQTKTTVLFPIRLDDAVMTTAAAWAGDIRRTRHIGDFRKWQDAGVYAKARDRLLRDLKK